MKQFWKRFWKMCQDINVHLSAVLLSSRSHGSQSDEKFSTVWPLVEGVAKEFCYNNFYWILKKKPEFEGELLYVFVIDEARHLQFTMPGCRNDVLSHLNRAARLNVNGGLFVFLDTLSDLNVFDPTRAFPSDRAKLEGTVQPVFTDILSWDVFSNQAGIKTIDETLALDAMRHFGRPLWRAFEYTDGANLEYFALKKLRCFASVPDSGKGQTIFGLSDPLANLATLSTRIAFDLVSDLASAPKLVGSYMAFLAYCDTKKKR